MQPTPGTVTSLFSSSSPDQQRALLEPWERRGGVGRCLRTSAAPFPASLLCRLQCPAPVLPVPPPVLRPTPPSRLTHRQFGRSSSSGRGGEGRPRLQSVVVQQQEGNTGRAAAAAAGCTTAADKYCRVRAVHHGDCCMLVPAAVQPTLALAVPPAMGAFARPGTFQQALQSAARIQSFPLCRSTEQSAKSAKAQF